MFVSEILTMNFIEIFIFLGLFFNIGTPFKRLKSETISFTNLEKNLINWSTINFHGIAFKLNY